MNNRILTLLSHSRIKQSYESGFWRDDTIFSLVRAHAAAAPDRIAVRDRRGALSYAELLDRAEAVAEDLAGHGLRAGDRVAVWLPSRIETAIAVVACSRAGFVCCPSFHRDHTSGDVLALLKRMRASAFIGEHGYGADADRHDIFEALVEVEGLKRIQRLDAVAAGSKIALPERSARATGEPNSDPNVVVYLAFTSGTTGQPKGVMHSDNTLLANARAMIMDWRFDASSVFYTMSPLSHNLGFGTLVMALATGGEIVVHDLPRGASTLDRLVEVGATFIAGVPTHAMDLLNEIKARSVSPPKSVKGFRISGASAPKELVAELLRLGITPQSGYGMTEAGSHHYTRITDGADRIVHSSGRSCDGYEVKIWSRDNPDVELTAGEVGQIGGRGASLMLGYYDDQAANDESYNASGWFMTGDLGRLDADGYIQITGRKKDLIIRGGHNIYPARIENLAMQHPAVARAAVLPVPDHRLGERVCLAAAARPGHRLDVQDILSHLDALGLSRYDMPEYFLELTEIPLTASGKIFKLDLISQLARGEITPAAVRWAPPKGDAT